MEHKEKLSAQTLEDLAEKVMQLNIHTLMIDLRYLQVALQQLTLRAELEGSLSTDGTCFFYRPRTVLQRYKKEPAASVRDYLHMVLHCIFRHMYLSEPVEVNCWDLACDMTVELMINGLGLRSTAARRQKEQKNDAENQEACVCLSCVPSRAVGLGHGRCGKCPLGFLSLLDKRAQLGDVCLFGNRILAFDLLARLLNGKKVIFRKLGVERSKRFG